MRSRLLLLFLFLLAPLSTFAQGEKWCSVVRESETKSAVAGAQILLIQEDKTVLRQAFSSEDGTFCIVLPVEHTGAYSLRISLLGYRTEVIPLEKLWEQEEILLTTQHFVLPEVQVRSRAVEERGDTVSYRAGAFTQATDVQLEDVLERLPDVTISREGMISYKGRSINRFYIEDMDLLGSRYTLATRNIRPEDVAAVEIYRHHEPIRLLRQQSHSDRAALNVRLKESAKDRWLRDLGGAIGGIPLIGKVNGSLMNFRPRRQTIVIAKWDNTGDDIIFDTRVQNIGMGVVFNPYRLSGGPANLFADRQPYSTFFGRDRRRDNRTGYLSINHLIGLSDASSIRLSLNGFHDRNRMRETREMHYYDPALGAIDLRETYDDLSRRSATEDEITYEYNGDQTYLKEILSVRYHHLMTGEEVSVNDRTEEVSMRLPSLQLSNSLTAKKFLDRHLYTAALGIGYGQKPQEMTIGGEESYRLSSGDLTASLALDGQFTVGSHRWTPELRAGLVRHHLEGLDAERESFRLDQQEYYAALALGYRYSAGGLLLELTPSVEERVRRGSTPTDPVPLPGLSGRLRYDHNGGTTALTYSYATTVPELEQYFPYLLRRSLTDYGEGISDSGVTRTQRAMLRREGTLPWDISYTLTGILSHTAAPRIYTLTVRDGRRVGGYLPQAVSSDAGSIRSELSKYFAGPMITLKGHAGYSDSRGTTYQQDLSLPYRSSGLSYGGALSWMGSTLLTLDYSIDATHSAVRIRDGREQTKIMRLEQNLRTTLLLGEQWGLSASLQHSYDRPRDFDPVHRLYVDASAYYTRGRVHLRLDLTNLTNVRDEYFRWTDGINSGSRHTLLRGREVLLTFTLKQ